MKPVVLYAGAAIVGIGAAIFLFASPMGGASPGDAPNDETTGARPSGGGATPGLGFGADEAEEGDEGGPNANKGGGRRDPAAKTQGPRPGTEELAKAQNSPFGQHGRKAAPAMQALANALTDQGATALAEEAMAIVAELRQQRNSPNVDSAPFITKERALLQKVKDGGYADAVSGEIARIEALIIELETGVGAPAAPDAVDAGAGAQ